MATRILLALFVDPSWCRAKLLLTGHRSIEDYPHNDHQVYSDRDLFLEHAPYIGATMEGVTNVPPAQLAEVATVVVPIPPPRPAINVVTSTSDSFAIAAPAENLSPLAASGPGTGMSAVADIGSVAAFSSSEAAVTAPAQEFDIAPQAESGFAISADVEVPKILQARLPLPSQLALGTLTSDEVEVTAPDAVGGSAETEPAEIAQKPPSSIPASLPGAQLEQDAVFAPLDTARGGEGPIVSATVAEPATTDVSNDVVAPPIPEPVADVAPDGQPTSPGGFPINVPDARLQVSTAEQPTVPEALRQTNPGVATLAASVTSGEMTAPLSETATPLPGASSDTDPLVEPQAMEALASPQLHAEADANPFLSTAYATPKPVKIEIFYETMCPACKYLLTQQLGAMYAENSTIPSWVELHLYPFGNGAVESAQAPYSFKCQHGEEECWGNKLHSCMVRHLGDAKLYVPLTICIAYNDQIPMVSAFQACAQRYSINVDAVANCTLSTQADVDMFALSQRTMSLEPPLEHTPWILINGVHIPEAEGGYLIDVTCSLLSQALLADGEQGSGAIPKACLGRALLPSTSLYRTPGKFLPVVPPPCKKGVFFRSA